MTTLKLSPNASGAGSFTIAAPSTSSDFTLNLPSTLGTNNGSALVSTDASGNLGLGVTPSAWGATSKAMQFSTGAIEARAGSFSLNNNSFFSSGWKYVSNGNATLYNQASGEHQWYTAPSGTAGNAITFTQAMTLDSSGQLGIGPTSPGSQLHLAKALSSTQTNAIQIQNTGIFTWGIGIDNAVSNSSLVIQSGGAGGTTRVAIDSSGNLLVGTTSASDTADLGIKLKNNSGDPYLVNVRSGSTNSFTTYAAYSTGAGAYRFYVGMGGTIYATSTSISAISDATLKENVRDLETGLTEVMALKPRRFDWKNGDAQNVAGFVAQEVEQVLPELVTDYVYNKDEDGNDIIKKSLKMGDILPTLVKAIQEQQTIINAQQTALEQLKAQLTSVSEDVAALKGAK